MLEPIIEEPVIIPDEEPIIIPAEEPIIIPAEPVIIPEETVIIPEETVILPDEAIIDGSVVDSVVEGVRVAGPEMAGLRRHNMDPHMGSPEYIREFGKLYPFAMVDFELPETFIGDATDGEHHVTPGAETHEYATPHECTHCSELELRINALEAELASLVGLRDGSSYNGGRRSYTGYGDYTGYDDYDSLFNYDYSNDYQGDGNYGSYY